jgi:hypothetical protein
MMIDNKLLALIAGVLLIILCALYWNQAGNQAGNQVAGLEGFIGDQDYEDSPRVPFEYDNQEPGDFPETVFERSLRTTFAKYPAMICSFLPTMRSSQCRINGRQLIKYKYPVHTIKLVSGKRIAVFNDGRLYLKTRMIDKLWEGPLRNSMPNRTVPLRMVTLNPQGDKLVGIGYDNKVYIKASVAESGEPDLEAEWQAVFGLEGYIYLMYSYDDVNNIYRMVLIDTDGKVKITNTDKPADGVSDYAVVGEPILKLIGDAEGYMMAIDTTFTLKTFETRDWWASKFSRKFTGNPMPVCDVIYDKDQLLFGLVFMPKVAMVEIMKQEEPHLMAPFVPFELNKALDSSTSSRRMTDRMIIKSKMGILPAQGASEEDALDDDVNMAYQRQLLNDKQRLRQFCSARGFNTDANYKNYSVLREIDANKEKINQLNTLIKDLVSFDPDAKPIQDAAIKA